MSTNAHSMNNKVPDLQALMLEAVIEIAANMETWFNEFHQWDMVSLGYNWADIQSYTFTTVSEHNCTISALSNILLLLSVVVC